MYRRTVCAVLLLSLVVPAAFGHGGRPPPPPPPPPVDPPDLTPTGPKTEIPRLGTPGDRRPPRRSTTPVPPAWEYVWGLSREEIIDLRRRQAKAPGVATEDPAGLTGASPRRDPRFSPAQAGAREAILQALLRALGDKKKDVVTSAIIGLAKAGDDRVIEFMKKAVYDDSKAFTIRESSALGLGLIRCGSEEIRTFLEKVARDGDRRPRTRAFALLGLGYHGHDGTIPFLMSRSREDEATRDGPACALLALGLLKNRMVVPDLARRLSPEPGRGDPDSRRRPYHAAAIGMIGHRSGLPALVAALDDPDEQVRRQAALSLGVLAGPEDEEAVNGLVSRLLKDRDDFVKAHAAWSLGEIGAPAAAPALVSAWQKGTNLVSPCALLGLGLLLRGSGDADLEKRLVPALRREFRTCGNAKIRGAIAIALGLAGDRASVPALEKVVAGGGNPTVRRHAATALGLIGDAAAAPALREALERRTEPDLVREAAIALAAMGDKKAAEALLDLIEKARADHAKMTAAVALGRIATPLEAKALIGILEDPRRTDLAREAAAVALGLVVDRCEVPLLSKLGDHFNYMMATDAVKEVLSIL